MTEVLPAEHAPERRDRASIPRAVWIVAAAAIAARVLVAVSTHFTAEDFLITLRYAENVAHGHGLVYNPGERVLGTTTPLYTLLLASASWAGLPAVGIGKACNILADGALCLVVYLWLRAMRQETAGRVAALWVAASPLHMRWAISGMETSLVTLGGALACLAFTQRRYWACYAVLGVLFLLRWDSALLAAAITIALVVRERRLPLRELGLYALIVAPWLAWATWYYGNPIPVTGAAKAAVYGWRGRHVLLPQLNRLLFRLAGTPIYAAVTLSALAGLVVAWRQRLWPLVPAVAWFALYWGAFLVSKVLLFEWYLVPPLPVWEALSGIGIAAAAHGVSGRWPHLARAAVGWTAAAAMLVGATTTMYRVSRETQGIEDHLRIPIGLWLRAHARPGDVVMLEPIGYIGYTSRLPVLDTVGLVTPKVLRYWNDAYAAPMLDIATAWRPDWCVLRPGELEHVVKVGQVAGEAWDARYVLAQTFSYTPRRGREPVVFHVFRRRPGW